MCDQSMEHNMTCRDQPTLVSQPYYRVDLFNRQMRGVLLTSILVTSIENKTVAHIGTSDGRLLQVWIRKKTVASYAGLIYHYINLFSFHSTACLEKVQPCHLCELLPCREPEGVVYRSGSLPRPSTVCCWR